MKTFIQTGFGVFVVIGLGVAAREAVALSGPLSWNSGRAEAQTTGTFLPNGVYPESRNRLPLIKRENLDELGKAIYDETEADMRSGRSLAGFQGPAGIGLYSPRVAEGDRRKNQYLRFDSQLGRRLSELAILVTARELDQQFEWTAHEPSALKAGLEPTIIDIVKYRRPVEGLQPKDATIIQLGREVLSRRSVDSRTFAEALKLFGEKDLVDLVSVISQYSATAVLLNVFDQQLAPGQKPLLPKR